MRTAAKKNFTTVNKRPVKAAAVFSNPSSAKLQKFLLEILSIPSPSFAEAKLLQFLQKKYSKLKKFSTRLVPGGLIVSSNPLNTKHAAEKASKPIKITAKNNRNNPHHIGFFGHLDVVPQHVAPRVVGNKVYGAGASDMKAGVAAMMYFIEALEDSGDMHVCTYTFVFYCCEEVSSISDNGLHAMLKNEGPLLKSINFAIVGEPTDETLQLGAVGSAHALVLFPGKSAHSARPWDGVNAVYAASSFVKAIANIPPKQQKVFGLDFYDVINITEVRTEEGRTTIPGWWQANVNYRFAPCYSSEQAQKNFIKLLVQAGASRKFVDVNSFVYAGTVVETKFFTNALHQLSTAGKLPLKAKQAWTDVAQLTKAGIPAVNYGPGLTAKCHRDDEYTKFSHLKKYVKNVGSWLQWLQNV